MKILRLNKNSFQIYPKEHINNFVMVKDNNIKLHMH
jgi:hypothetical protein